MMFSSRITFFVLVQSALAACRGDANKCKAPSSETLVMVQHAAGKIGASDREKESESPNLYNSMKNRQPVTIVDSYDFGKNFADWSFCNSTFSSNLGGEGPDTGAAAELRYYNVFEEAASGVSADLVVTATSEYTPHHVSENGIHDCFGIINLKSDKNGGDDYVDLTFSMVKTGTYEPVAFSLTYFTIYDMDTDGDGEGGAAVDGNDESVEAVTFYEKATSLFRYNATVAPKYTETGDLAIGSGLTFTATEYGTGADNPGHPINMDEDQKAKSITASYHNVSSWKITFSVVKAKGCKGGRNFMFAGQGPLAPTPSPTPSPPSTVFGHGDPHMVNIRGDKFNIWQLGEAELLKIPRDSSASTAALRFLADVTEAGKGSGNCTRPPYMTTMRLGGSWLGTSELFVQMVDGEMRALLGGKSLNPSLEPVKFTDQLRVTRPSKARVTVEVGNATIDVRHGGQHGHLFYLNMEARNLATLGFEIGGILGLDDHTVVAQQPAHCKHELLAVVAERHGSHASASLQN